MHVHGVLSPPALSSWMQACSTIQRPTGILPIVFDFSNWLIPLVNACALTHHPCSHPTDFCQCQLASDTRSNYLRAPWPCRSRTIPAPVISSTPCVCTFAFAFALSLHWCPLCYSYAHWGCHHRSYAMLLSSSLSSTSAALFTSSLHGKPLLSILGASGVPTTSTLLFMPSGSPCQRPHLCR